MLKALRDPAWFYTQRLSHIARGPWRHVHLWLEKHSVLTDGMDSDNVAAMALLVWHKADIFAREFGALIRKGPWAVLLEEHEEHISCDAATRIDSAVVSLTLNAAAEYDMRIRAFTKRFPARWLLWAAAPANEVCEERKQVASELVAAMSEELDITTAKLTIIFQNDLLAASRDGKLSDDLHATVWWVARYWKADTQSIEGLNSVLKGLIARGPNISLPLCSARLSLKHALGFMGLMKLKKKFSVVWPIAQQLLETCVEHYNAMDETLGTPGRWVLEREICQEPVLSPQEKATMAAPTLISPLGLVWASNMNGVWYYACRHGLQAGQLPLKGVSLDGPVSTGSIIWVCGTTLNQIGHWARCVAQSDRVICLEKPLAFRPSLLVFQDYFDVG